jgi:Leucine-rich repeat (LRR) protein
MKLLFGLLVLALNSFSFGQQQGCEHCYSLERAMVQPSKVKSLLLSNQAMKRVPKDISQFSNLTYLDIGFNNIQHFPDSAFLHKNLKKININRNPGIPEKELFQYLRNFPNLEEIHMNYCGIYELPAYIAELKKLKRLNLKGNSVNSLPIELNELFALTELDISENMFRSLPYVLGGQWSLEKLVIDGNPLEGMENVIKHLKNLPEFKDLTISIGPDLLKKSHAFRDLNLHQLTITNSTINSKFERLFNNTPIKSLTFKECTFDENDGAMRYGVIENISFVRCTSIPDLSAAKSLSRVSVAASRGAGVQLLGELENLVQLDLRAQDLSVKQKTKLIDQLPNTKVLMDNYPFSDLFASNSVEPIAPIEPKEFTLSSKESKTIVLDNMKLAIQPNSFALANGEIYDGEVKIEIKEYFDPVSMVLDGIPMTFENNGQKELFGSNGMFDIRVETDAGEELFPNPSNAIQVSMNDMQPENEGDLFYLDEETNEWENAPESNTVNRSNNNEWRQRIVDSINELNLEDRISIQEIPIFLSVRHKRRRHDPSLLHFQANTSPGFKSFKSISNSGYVIYQKNYAQREIAKYEWKIDTLMTKELDTLLRKLKKRSKISRKQKDYAFEYGYRGREIKNIQIIPDIESDNFRLVFYHRNEKISLPVFVANRSENTGSIMKNQLKFYRKYEIQKKKDIRSEKKEARKKKRILKKSTNNLRAQLIQQAIWARQNQLFPNPWSNTRTEQNSFGLTSFGLVNIDYFSKNRPADYIVMSETMQNQNGESFEVPENLSVLLFESNSILGTTRKQVPIMKNSKSLVVMTLENDQVGVAKATGTRNKVKWELNTFTITDLMPGEVHEKIMALR